MPTYAVVDGAGLVVNRIVVDGEPTLGWSPGENLSAVPDADDEYLIGGAFIAGVYTPAPGAPAEPVDLTAYAANARWQKESGGTVVAGVPIATDDRSKQMLLGARVAADANPAFSTPWVGADGSIYPLTGAEVIGISNAVLAHVAACFSIFAAVKAAIDNGEITTTAEIDAAFA